MAEADPGRLAPPINVCFPFAGGMVGGSHISACQLIKSLDPAHYRPLVVVHQRGGQFEELLADEKIAFEVAPAAVHFGRMSGLWQSKGIGDHARAAMAVPGLARFLKQRQVDIVHTNEGAMHITWALPARMAGAKLLWHHRSSPEARGLRHLAPHFADKVVGVSAFALSHFNRKPRRVTASVVYSPFDTDIAVDRSAMRAKLLAELGLPETTTIVGYFGNFVARKRPLLFVDVIAELAARAPERTCVGLMFGGVIDQGLDAEVVERAAVLGVSSKVKLMGFRRPGADWLAACDTLAVTAVGEPFGRTLIEAMLLETAVVAVDTGGNSEAIRHGETGLLARVDDAGAIAESILQLADHPEQRARIVAAARQDALDRYGRTRHRQGVEAAYRELLPCRS
ncbi:glycosyltransferase family 4 protein [Glacieibacterium sp.]|uniref:glycosyltransferase family 4 protein n=1 Tax=Glacieibacterium sp. TaxID=2860237 RepID=UPI003AFF858B